MVEMADLHHSKDGRFWACFVVVVRGGGSQPRPGKMIKTAGKLRGKIKARITTFSNRGKNGHYTAHRAVVRSVSSY